MSFTTDPCEPAEPSVVMDFQWKGNWVRLEDPSEHCVRRALKWYPTTVLVANKYQSWILKFEEIYPNAQNSLHLELTGYDGQIQTFNWDGLADVANYLVNKIPKPSQKTMDDSKLIVHAYAV